MGKGKTIGIALGIVIAAFIGLAAIGASQTQYQGVTSNKESFTPRNESVIVTEGITEVEPGGFVVYTFSAPKDATNVKLKGEFISESDGINVFVADETIFEQYKEGRRVFFSGNLYYTTADRDTGEHRYVDSGTVDVSLYQMYGSVKGESLYLVFNNREDPDHSKQVNANFTLSYSIYVPE